MQKPYRGNIYDVSQKDLMNLIDTPLDMEKIDMSKYDALLLGYPTWWATLPRPVVTFVKNNDLRGKLICPFQSHGGTFFGEAVSDLAKLAAGSRVCNGFEFEYSGGFKLKDRLDAWLKDIIY